MKTNITLASLADLTEATQEHLVDAVVGAVNWRRVKAYNRLREIKKQRYDDEYFPPTVLASAPLMILESMLEEAARNEYPIVYDKGLKKLETLDELLSYADEVTTAAEQWTPTD